ncbi:MAG: hypothetical protein IKA65_01595 [Lentisphaeria bacterium]|nr:hypothetical protein [Lentisphaeria bacterium]
MGEYGERAKPAAAGRRAAPASYTLGNAPTCHTHIIVTIGGNARPTCPTCPTSPTAATQTIATVGGTINPLLPVIYRYTPFCRHQPYCPLATA